MINSSDGFLYIPIDTLISPIHGVADIYIDQWWVHHPNKGLAFYKRYTSPQCNKNEGVAKLLTRACHPKAECIKVPVVFVPHNCGDYM